MPRMASNPRTPRFPKGKSGICLYHMYEDPMTAVASMRTKIICSAWNFVSKLVSRSRVVIDIYPVSWYSHSLLMKAPRLRTYN